MGNSLVGDNSKDIQIKLKSSLPKHSHTDFRCDDKTY